MNRPHTYFAHGMTIASEIEIPEFGTSQGEADLDVSIAGVPECIPDCRRRGVRFQAAPGHYLLTIDGVASYEVLGGHTVRIQPAAGSSESDIRVFLHSSVMGAVVHQRGLLPLHASSVEMFGRAVLIAGASRSGKSTLAMALNKKGFPIISEDLTVLRATPAGTVLAFPGTLRFKLTPRSVGLLSIPENELRPGRQGTGKFFVSPSGIASKADLEVSRIYWLTPSVRESTGLRPLTGVEKFSAVMTNTFRHKFVDAFGTSVDHFQHCSSVTRAVPVARLCRNVNDHDLDGLAELIKASENHHAC
ncbi:MAG: hypothetical protein ACI9BV_003798 [Rhodothermales bacterium]|jgi:hypothetical protein